MKKVFSDEQVLYIENNYKNMTYKEMSELDLFDGLSEKQIRNKARNLGFSKTRKFNDDFFHEINTKEKAYWLGFIYADGYVVFNKDRSNYEFAIEIHQNDEYMLHNLNILLGGVHSIIRRRRNIAFNGYEYISLCSSLRVYHKRLCEDLMSNGILTNKTESSIYPKVSRDDLLFHFIRGFFDGDGMVSKITYGYCIHFTNSNNHFLEYIQHRLLEFNIQSKIYKEKDKKFRLYVNKSNSYKLLELMYIDSEDLRLERKYEIYNSQWLSHSEMIG